MAENKKKTTQNKKTNTKSPQKKNSNNNSSRNSAAAKKKQDTVNRNEANKQIASCVLFAVALFLLCVILIPSGVKSGDGNAWQAIKDGFFGIFGLGACAVPFILGFIALSVSREMPVTNMIIKVIGFFFASVGVTSFMHLIFNKGDYLSNAVISEQISNAWNVGFRFSNPGAIGALFGGFLSSLFGKTAAIFTLIIIVFVLFMLLTGTSLARFVEVISVPFYKLADYIRFRMDSKEDNAEKQNKPKREKAEYKTPQSEDIFTDEDNKSRRRRKHTENEQVTEVEVVPADVTLIDAVADEDTDSENVEIPTFSPMPIPSFGGTPVYNPENDLVDVESVAVAEENVDSEPADIPISRNPVRPADEVIDLINKAGEQKDDSIAVQQTVDSDDEDEEEAEPEHVYVLPDVECLAKANSAGDSDIKEELTANANKLVETLRSFNIETKIVDIARGPSVTRYEIQPAPGIKISRIANLADDIAMNLAASGVRIEAPIPNKAAVGIEIPNRTRLTVSLREIIDSPQFKSATSKLNVALGKDISGNVTCTDLAKMPHLLIAGTTGSGKSVCLNAMIISILFNSTPDEVKLIMIDPKQVEFTVYKDIPHLMVPVVSDPRKAAGALAWAVSEMSKRYKMFSEKGVRDIKGYNKMAAKDPEMTPMHQIVIFIDELSDLMMVAQNEVEDSICRLAQMARAAGMHLVIATQRPSVNVITGIIKANIPSRIALFVSSQVDSRTIIDTAGAEKLLGNGDMLFSPVGISKPVRLQGCYVSDEEVERVVDFIKTQGECEYDSSVMEEIEKQAVAEKKKEGYQVDADASPDSGADEETMRAIGVVVEHQMASTTLLQRKLKIGYAKAARIMDELEEKGVIGPFEGSKPRKVLMSKQQYNEMLAMGSNSFVSLGSSEE